jgi:Uma2 family endonuclease
MQVQLPEAFVEATVRIETGCPLDDDAFWDFCVANPDLRIEREPNGDIVIMPPTGFDTGYRNSDIGFQLTAWAMKDGRGAAVNSNAEYYLPTGAARSPDASWVLRSRLTRFTKEEKEKFLHLCPDFVVELMSTSGQLPKAKARMQAWIDNGAQVAWLIHPKKRTVYIHRPGREPEESVDLDSVAGEGPVAGFALELNAIWEGV